MSRTFGKWVERYYVFFLQVNIMNEESPLFFTFGFENGKYPSAQ